MKERYRVPDWVMESIKIACKEFYHDERGPWIIKGYIEARAEDERDIQRLVQQRL